jgi:hypothetical protein
MDYDPEHNAVVLYNFRDKWVWEYRPRAVSVGPRMGRGSVPTR